VAANPSTSRKILLQLATDPASPVRLQVAKREDLDVETLQRLLFIQDMDVLTEILTKDLPIEIAALAKQKAKDFLSKTCQLARGDQEPQDRHCSELEEELTQSSDVPGEFSEEVCEGVETRKCHIVACSSRTPPNILRTLSERKEIEIRRCLAANKGTPSDVLERLSADPDWTIRQALAMNSAAPQTVLRPLADDPDPRIRLLVARNPRTPETLLKRIVSTNDFKSDLALSARATNGNSCMEDFDTDPPTKVCRASHVEGIDPNFILAQIAAQMRLSEIQQGDISGKSSLTIFTPDCATTETANR
jgi:hypothetical protein